MSDDPLAILRAALKEYGRHRPLCAAGDWFWSDYDQATCDCGLAAAIREGDKA